MKILCLYFVSKFDVPEYNIMHKVFS